MMSGLCVGLAETADVAYRWVPWARAPFSS
jgi:hypothetical protein